MISDLWAQYGVSGFGLVIVAGWLVGLTVNEVVSLLLNHVRPRDHLPVMSVLCAVAPLLGLLGTVQGIIEVFSVGVTAGDTVALGIGRALWTTQFGLCIAVPGLVARQLLLRWREVYSCQEAVS